MTNTFSDDTLRFDWNFENASLGSVTRMGKDWYHLDLRPDTWFWFHFRLTGCKGRKVVFEVPAVKPQGAHSLQWFTGDGVHRPFYSTGNGTWHAVDHAEADSHLDAVRFWHTFDSDDVRLCFGVPYGVDDLERFLKTLDHPDLTCMDAGKSRTGLPVHWLRIAGEKTRSAERKKGVWLIYREDSAEVVGSFAAEGAARFLLSDDPDAVALRNACEFNLIPMIGIDGVAAGANFSAGYGYMTNRWHEEPGPEELRAAKSAMRSWVAEGHELLVVGKHHGHVHFRGGNTYFHANGIPIGQALASRSQAEGSYFQLLLRVTGRLDRWVIDTFGYVPTFAVELYATNSDPDYVRKEGESIIRGLRDFFDDRVDYSKPLWQHLKTDR